MARLILMVANWWMRNCFLSYHGVAYHRDEAKRAARIREHRVMRKAWSAHVGLIAAIEKMRLDARLMRDACEIQAMRAEVRRNREWAEIQKRIRGHG